MIFKPFEQSEVSVGPLNLIQRAVYFRTGFRAPERRSPIIPISTNCSGDLSFTLSTQSVSGVNLRELNSLPARSPIRRKSLELRANFINTHILLCSSHVFFCFFIQDTHTTHHPPSTTDTQASAHMMSHANYVWSYWQWQKWGTHTVIAPDASIVQPGSFQMVYIADEQDMTALQCYCCTICHLLVEASSLYIPTTLQLWYCAGNLFLFTYILVFATAVFLLQLWCLCWSCLCSGRPLLVYLTDLLLYRLIKRKQDVREVLPH